MAPKIDFEEINKIIKLLEDKNLAEFELEIDGFKIKIGRNNSNIAQAAVAYQPAAAPAAGIPGLVPETGPEMRGDAHAVVSPMVGTFYRAPSPSSPPFVDVGDVVKKRQILCIVEAMKLMNEIESDADGVIKEICVENGKPVEYGQKLFVIVPQA